MIAKDNKDAERIISDLMNNGFKEYRPTRFDSPYIVRAFQKRYRDEDGKTMFFIDVHMFDEMIHPHTKDTFPPSFELCAQLYRKGTHDAINMLFLSSWDVKMVEDFIKQMFANKMLDNYDCETE